MSKLVIAFTILLSVSAVSQSFAADKVPDADITYWVWDAIQNDPRVDVSEITVSTKKGIVTLSGSVDNLAAKKYADLEAKKIKGVLGVINKISVTPGYRSDADIGDDVRRRILNSVTIKSQGLTVTCNSGKVTLSGMVDSLSESEEAGLLASEVRGVRDVRNNMLIRLTKKRSDQEIKNDAVAALERDVYLSGLPITVTVKDAVITLTGSVGNAYEKERATEDVHSMMHIRGVKNKLKVEWLKNRGVRKDETWPSPDALKNAVLAELDQDSRVDASDITVKAAYGHVTLEGSVSDDYQKRIAEQDVRDVVGVKWVTSNLFVTIEQREDRAVRDDVQLNLDTDFTLEGFDLHTKVKDGVVTLSGSVHAWYEKRYAGDVAARVSGVKKVINNIKVDWERR